MPQTRYNYCSICHDPVVTTARHDNVRGPAVVWYVPEGEYDRVGPYPATEYLLDELCWVEGSVTPPGYRGYWPVAAHKSCMEEAGITSLREIMDNY